MEKRTRRHFSPEDKVAIIKRHLLEGVSVADLCEEIGLHPVQFYQWQKQFFEQGAAAFKSSRPDPSVTSNQREIDRLKAKLAQKDSVIAEISQEYVSLKKELGEP
jgi:transposase